MRGDDEWTAGVAAVAFLAAVLLTVFAIATGEVVVR